MANTISVNIVADVKGIRDGIDDVNKKLGGLNDSAGKVGGMLKTAFAGAAVFAAGGQVVDFLKDAVSEARESQKVNALTESTIKSMGNQAGISAKQIGDLATSLSNKTAIDDEVIQSGANLVLTFGNIKNAAGAGNDVFNQTVGLANDMSVALGQDMKSSSIQLGKALNDPIKGVSALSRVGVSFTAQQKEQIKTLVESGDVLGAQKVILAEVQKQFGGAGEAAANPMEKLKVTIGNLKETIGTALLPILDRFATYVTKNLPSWIETGKQAIETLKTAWSTISPVVEAAFAVFKNVGGFFLEHKGVLLGVVGAVTALMVVTQAHAAVMAVQAAGGIAAYIAQMGIVQTATKVWTAVQWLLNTAMLANPITLIIVAIVALIAIVVLAWKNSETFREIVIGAWNAIKDAAGAVWDWIKNAISTAFEFLKNLAVNWSLPGLIVKHWDTIKNAAGAVWDWIKDKVGGAFDWIKNKIVLGMEGIRIVWNAVWNGAKNLVDSVWEGIKSGVSNGISAVVGFVTGIREKILGALTGAATWLYNIGKDIIQGLINGIKNMVGKAIDAVVETGKKIIDGAKGILGIKSPSKVFAAIGQDVNRGLVKGLKNTAGVKDAASGLSKAVADGFSAPTLAMNADFGSGGGMRGGSETKVEINFNGLVTDPVAVGKEIEKVLSNYVAAGGRVSFV